MSKDWKVKETGASCKLVFVSTDNPVKELWEKLRNQAKLDKIEKIDICVLCIFWALLQLFVHGELVYIFKLEIEYLLLITGSMTASSYFFDIFINFDAFSKLQ